MPYDWAPKYIIRDREKFYGANFVRRVHAMGIEQHLRRILHTYLDYYHGSRTHLALDKDAPKLRKAESTGEGKLEVARAVLLDALNTQVITHTVLPLPVLRAGVLIRQAEGMIDDSERTQGDNDRVKNLVDNARHARREVAEDRRELEKLAVRNERSMEHIRARAPTHHEHEPPRQLLRQRGGRVVFQQLEEGTDS